MLCGCTVLIFPLAIHFTCTPPVVPAELVVSNTSNLTVKYNLYFRARKSLPLSRGCLRCVVGLISARENACKWQEGRRISW